MRRGDHHPLLGVANYRSEFGGVCVACNIRLHASAAIYLFFLLRSTNSAQKVHRQSNQHDAKPLEISSKVQPKSTKVPPKTPPKWTLDTSQLHFTQKGVISSLEFQMFGATWVIFDSNWAPRAPKNRAFWHPGAPKNQKIGSKTRSKKTVRILVGF